MDNDAVIQFVEMVRQGYADIQVAENRPYHCDGCGCETKHVYLETTKNRREKYRCLKCGLIREVAV